MICVTLQSSYVTFILQSLHFQNMDSDNYIPHPIDTSDMELPQNLLPLVEEMAKNVHEIWSQMRIRQGWRYGEKRDDTFKW